MDENAYRKRLKAGQALVAAHAQRWLDTAHGLAVQLGWPDERVHERVRAFDRARLDMTPSVTLYPELRGYRDRIDAEDRGKRDAGASDTLIALSRSLGFYCQTLLLVETGKAYRAAPLREKCRVLYVPNAAVGPVHAKNVDDPVTYFKPQPATPAGTPWPLAHPLVFDGVGSGLHIDEIPPELFPADPWSLCLEHCTALDEARQFLERYNYFWRGCNLLIHDQHGQSLAFDKTACRLAVHRPDGNGVNWVTGMGARDPAIAAFQKAMRQKYLDQIGDDATGPDACYWRHSDGQYRNMERYVRELPPRPTLEQINALMEQRDPDGSMCLTGQSFHPDAPAPGWTLQMRCYLLDQKQLHLRQYRNGTPAYLDTPEVIQYV